MIALLTGIITESWRLLVEAAPFVLFGFLAAGLLKALIPENFVARHLGKSSSGSVIKASLLGIPLPLCSCGVIPAAIGLRKQGASKGASAAFLISTPESGVDSIAITWALLDPLMTIARPVAALLSATVTGLFINLLPEDKTGLPAYTEADTGSTCQDACCKGHQHPTGASMKSKLTKGMRFAFGDLLGDIGTWLLIGILISGVISYLLPASFFAQHLQGEWSSLFIMLVVGIPLYICASASTPIAAAMVLKGLSPGAALVFLLAGPATNAATITVISKFWGKKVTLIYLATIASTSLLIGWLLNRVYALLSIDITQWVSTAETETGNPLAVISALLLLALIARSLFGNRCAD
ncbi:membrane protein DUF318 [Syntrophotalea carbinolica DSM 2380]|uniref:Membrane protein DUF318 n=1 Tax=Syntrophotalea carbinolica (strain DSM 2380 / NBRC 103641 / GraBd1) TaxID=338963 RepID=Q3A7N1_SYNC1|nr:SO_0444 family Cu/Zn efflux transporter [Syntrophotalea carbinolica]ABA87613.1 membrane protein DUF318 [Syntrophotalea carbinolica DSM 2380]